MFTLPLPVQAYLKANLKTKRRRAIAGAAAIGVLALSGSTAAAPFMLTGSPIKAAAAAKTEPLEGQSYYYDALWPGTVVVPLKAAAQPASAVKDNGNHPYNLTSSSGLTSSGIPVSAYRAYVAAADQLGRTDPGCRISWTLIAGIGRVESNHGRYGGSSIGPDGVVSPPILGVRLDGTRPGMARISDSDGGKYDGDPVFDRAVGPMQFLPGTWKSFGGGRNPQDMNAAALAAGKYLCQGNLDLSTQTGRWAAVYRYNHSDSYVSLVLSLADAYASGRVTTFETRPAKTPVVSDDSPTATAPGKPPSVPDEPEPPKPGTPTGRPTTAPAGPTTPGIPGVPGLPGRTSTPTRTTPPTTTTAPPTTTTTEPAGPTSPTTDPTTDAPQPTTPEPTTEAPTTSPAETTDPAPESTPAAG